MIRRPKDIEDYLVTIKSGQWFGWSDSSNKTYENLIIYNEDSLRSPDIRCMLKRFEKI